MGLGHSQMRARLKASITGPSRTGKVPSKETIGQPKVITALEDEHQNLPFLEYSTVITKLLEECSVHMAQTIQIFELSCF